MLLLLALSLAGAAVALLVSRATITEPIREAAFEWLKPGLRCPFCVAFWASAGLVAVYGPPGLLPWPLAVLAIWGGAAATVGLADPGTT